MLYDFTEIDKEVPLQAGVTVSSRSFRKAVHRNRIKRILREAYRLQKLPLQQLLEEKNLQLRMFFIYTGKVLPVFNEVNEKMETILKRVSEVVVKAPGI